MQEVNEVNGDKQAAGQTDRVPEEEANEISDLKGEVEQKKGNGTCLEVKDICIKEEYEERCLERIGQHNYSKPSMKKVSGPEEKEEEAAVNMEDSVVFDTGMNFIEGIVKRNETEEAEVHVEQKEEEIKGKSVPHDRTSRRQRIRSMYKVKLRVKTKILTVGKWFVGWFSWKI